MRVCIGASHVFVIWKVRCVCVCVSMQEEED